MSLVPHIADAEDNFKVVTVTPDFCRVGKYVIPFFPTRHLTPEKMNYAQSVFARGEQVLMVDSIVKGVKGNAGKGIKSGVSQGNGNVEMKKGSNTVHVEGRKVMRHNDQCLMNVEVK